MSSDYDVAPGTDAKDVTDEPDTQPSVEPEPVDEGETTGLAEG